MSWSEIIIILAVGMFVLGPERIPVAVKWVGSTLKTVRTMAAGAQEQLRGEFGPELDELRRQVEELQGLKEIQELRKLRDLNPRSLITKNILGEEFSGGLTGMLGLNQPVAAAQPTGPGVSPEVDAAPTTLDFPSPDPVQLTKQQPVEFLQPEHAEPPAAEWSAASEPVIHQPVVNEPVGNEPVVDRPVVNEPVVNEPVVNEPVVNGVASQGHAVNGHSAGRPADAVYSAAATPRHAAASPYDLDAT